MCLTLGANVDGVWRWLEHGLAMAMGLEQVGVSQALLNVVLYMSSLLYTRYYSGKHLS